MGREDNEEASIGDTPKSQASQWPFYRIGAPDHLLVPRGSECQELSDLLGQVTETHGELSFGDAASMLPALPGLTVENVGQVSLPLRRENALVLKNQARKCQPDVWLLTPDQVEMTNPEWAKGINKLCELCAERLGYKGIELIPVMTMVLLFGEGSWLEDRQARDPTNCCVAKLTVQLPSFYAGGDLVVHEEGKAGQLRYSMGKEDGTAPFRPHYAVYTSGEYRVVEPVTSGYRLTVMYSLCLPAGLKRGKPSSLLRCEVSEVIKQLTGGVHHKTQLAEAGHCDNTIIALMLSQSYSTESIEKVGSRALSGLDHERLRVLEDANSMLPQEQQLRFYIAGLQYQRSVISNVLGLMDGLESVSWYLMSGGKISDAVTMKWTEKLNFLNPGNETLASLWGCSNDSFPDYNHEEHSRFTIVAWPVAVDANNTLAVIRGISENDTSEAESSNIHVVGQPNLDVTSKAESSDAHVVGQPGPEEERVLGPPSQPSYATCPEKTIKSSTLLLLCRQLAQTVTESGDLYLVDKFFSKYFSRLKEKCELVPLLADIVRKFGWNDVNTSLFSSISGLPSESRMGLALQLASALTDKPEAHTALTIFAVERARTLFSSLPDKLTLSSDLNLLWKHAMACKNPQALIDLTSLFKSMDGELLGPVVDYIMKCADTSSLPEFHDILLPVASKRRQWLVSNVFAIMTPFTWQVSDIDFPDAAAIVKYLEGSSTALVIRGFGSLEDAQARASLLRQKIKAPITITANRTAGEASVRILKIGGAYDPRANEIPVLMAEIERIGSLLSLKGDINNENLSPRTIGNKRQREDAGHMASMFME